MASDIQFPATYPGTNTFDARLLDNNGAPANVLEAAKDIELEVQWTIDAALAAILGGGEWVITAYIDPFGSNPEQQFGSTLTVPVDGSTHYGPYKIKMAGGTLPDLDPGGPTAAVSGAYKVVALLGHRSNGKFTDVSALVELPMVRIG